MSKLRETKGLPSETWQWIRGLPHFSAVLPLVLAAALFAAPAQQAAALDPGAQSGTSETASSVTTSRYRIGPSLPDLHPSAEPLHLLPIHDIDAWFHGVASWYGSSFNGRLTANGEVYDMYAMTAATSEFRTTLPLGTKVRVINSHNGRAVVVRITDRGPLPKGRIIDLSYGAARRLAMVKPGTAQVRVHVLRWGKNRYRRQSR